MKGTGVRNFTADQMSLLEAIHGKYSYDFRHYSPASMTRTLDDAMKRLHCETLASLQKKVLADEDSFADLIQSLTIPVSEMFRDPEYFLAVRQYVCPFLKTYPSLKVWIAGCSSGEEVYSLAILLKEEGLLARTILYATDINAKSLEKAQKGAFSLLDIQAASDRYLKSGGKHALTDYYDAQSCFATFHSGLVANVTFSDHSLATDAVFSETHFISCRNVLIYFDRQLQNQVIGLFNDSLCRKCFLGLGAKETINFSTYAENFEELGYGERIFQKL